MSVPGAHPQGTGTGMVVCGWTVLGWGVGLRDEHCPCRSEVSGRRWQACLSACLLLTSVQTSSSGLLLAAASPRLLLAWPCGHPVNVAGTVSPHSPGPGCGPGHSSQSHGSQCVQLLGKVRGVSSFRSLLVLSGWGPTPWLFLLLPFLIPALSFLPLILSLSLTFTSVCVLSLVPGPFPCGIVGSSLSLWDCRWMPFIVEQAGWG